MIIVICILVMLCCIAYLIFRKTRNSNEIENIPETSKTDGSDYPSKGDSLKELLDVVKEANWNLCVIKFILCAYFIASIIGAALFLFSYYNYLK